MTDVTVYDDDNPDGRPAADAELAGLLDGMTAADGTSYLDLFNASRDDR